MALIALGLGALAFQVGHVLKKEQFERGVEQVIGKLSLAQEIMLDFHTDVTLTIHQKEESLLCQLECATPMPHQLEKGFNTREAVKGVDQILFNEEPKTLLTLQFERGLGVAPKGELTLLYRDLKETIYLRGYPTQLKKEPGGEWNERHPCEATYPEEILSSF